MNHIALNHTVNTTKYSKLKRYSITLVMLITGLPTYAQADAKLEAEIKLNTSQIIQCVNKQSYYDTLEELDSRFNDCTKQLIPHLDTESNDASAIKYIDALYEESLKHDEFQNTVNTIIAREDLGITDQLYDTGDKYKTIEDSLVGSYQMYSGEPTGGTSFTLLDNKKFAIYGFGFAKGGDWRVVKGKYLHLIPYSTAYPFNVYGRQDISLGKRSKIRFYGDDFDYQTLVNYDNTIADTPLLTPVFNSDANCFSWPYDGEFPETYQKLTLADNPDYENKGEDAIDTYTYANNKNFNNFYVFTNRKSYKPKTIKAIIKPDGLVMDSQKIKKSPLPEAGTENAEFMTYVATKKTSPDIIFYNPAGRSMSGAGVNPADYTYDDILKAMVANEPCTEGYCPPQGDYDNYDIFYKYEVLKDITHNKTQFTIAEEPIIHTVCEGYP